MMLKQTVRSPDRNSVFDFGDVNAAFAWGASEMSSSATIWQEGMKSVVWPPTQAETPVAL
jgi:hypothetical protein